MKHIIKKIVFRIFAVMLVLASLMISRECLFGLVGHSVIAVALSIVLAIMCVIVAVLLWTYDDEHTL